MEVRRQKKSDPYRSVSLTRAIASTFRIQERNSLSFVEEYRPSPHMILDVKIDIKTPHLTFVCPCGYTDLQIHIH